MLLTVGLSAVFLAILIAVCTLVFASAGRSNVAKGLAAIDQVYAPGVARSAPHETRRTDAGLGALARLLTPRSAAAWMQRWLDYAGNPAAWPPDRIMGMQGLGLIVLGVLGMVVGLAGKGVFGAVAGGVIGGLAGLWSPFAIVYDAGVKRQQHIARELPDALDLLTLSVEAGLGFDAALAQVATTMPGPLAREISRTLQEMQMGVRRADAMRALAARSRVVELRTMATAVMQAGELGIPIADVLRQQSVEMRLKRRQRAEEQAGKVPVKVVIPLILCLFPALFIVVIGPAVVNLMDSFTK